MAGVYAERLRRVRRAMRARSLPAIYFTAPTSRQYLTGFSGTAGAVLITPRGSGQFFTDFRYTERALSEVAPEFQVHEVSRSTKALLVASLQQARVKRLGIEDSELTVAEFQSLQNRLPRIRLVGVGSLLLEQRGIKDNIELTTLRQAIRSTDDVFAIVVKWLRQMKRQKRLPTEEAIAWKIRDVIHTKRLGDLAFSTIVASGPNAARPHHEPTRKRLHLGEMVILDLGVKVGGYHADMTRTVFLGQPTARQRAMYLTTLQAQATAIRYLRQGGRSAGEADAVARKIIDAKFPRSFGHALGHGVGLEIHEYPTLGPKSKHVLKAGMVFSVEPGIYLKGEGGIRIEDLVLLKKDGCEVLSQSRKKLLGVTI